MEELKLVLESIEGLGAEAKEAFIWYMFMRHGLDFLSGLFGYGFGVGLLVAAYRFGRHTIATFSLGGRVHKIMGYSGDIYKWEAESIVDTITKWKNQK